MPKGKGVTGAGGVTSSPGSLVGPVSKAGSGNAPANGIAPCPLKKHFIKIRLRHKDDNSDVTAAACKILKGSEETSAGPLAGGILEVKDIEAGSYEVTFPEIDAAEWSLG